LVYISEISRKWRRRCSVAGDQLIKAITVLLLLEQRKRLDDKEREKQWTVSYVNARVMAFWG
jgi:hypothetical protein